MRLLIIGGTGMIGAHAALHLRDRGHDVTVAGRNPAPTGSPVVDFAFLAGDYMTPSFTREQLSEFEGVVFAAGQDPRHRADAEDESFWSRSQSVGVPRFAKLAKEAGVRRFVQVGSYYHQLRPELAGTNPYIRARQDADVRARGLADDSFNACTLNPPSIIGVVPGASATRYRRMVSWAAGNEPDVPDHAPPGGTNYMSARSLAEAIGSALENAETGRAYLLGDQNLTYQEFFQMMVDAAGGARTIGVRDQEHPLLPDAAIVQGRGNRLAYEPRVGGLEYGRDDCVRGVQALVDVVRSTMPAPSGAGMVEEPSS